MKKSRFRDTDWDLISWLSAGSGPLTHWVDSSCPAVFGYLLSGGSAVLYLTQSRDGRGSLGYVVC